MFKYLTSISAAELLSRWLEEGLVARDRQTAIREFSLRHAAEEKLPIYLRVLAGVGAFLSSLFFFIFLSISQIISFKSEAALLIWGLLFIGAAIYLARMQIDRESAVLHSFLMQTSFCFIALGKILFVWGATLLLKGDQGWAFTAATFLISLVTYYVYRMSLDRFISALAVFLSLYFNLITEDLLPLWQERILALFFVFQVLLAGFLFTHSRVRVAYLPLAYAVATSLGCMVLHGSATQVVRTVGVAAPALDGYMTTTLTLALAGLIIWAAGGLQRVKMEVLFVALGGIVLLGCLSAPGILLAIALLILGYSKHERPLIVLGGLLLPCFIIIFYYSLQATFMVKAGILVTSGVLLLLGRAYLALRRLDGSAL